jgi:hypothetical protein
MMKVKTIADKEDNDLGWVLIFTGDNEFETI